MALLQGMNLTALVQLWSVTVRIKSYPWERGSLVMKSTVIILKGLASGNGYMGCSSTLVGRLFTL
jgi:hypothetical protein